MNRFQKVLGGRFGEIGDLRLPCGLSDIEGYMLTPQIFDKHGVRKSQVTAVTLTVFLPQGNRNHCPRLDITLTCCGVLIVGPHELTRLGLCSTKEDILADLTDQLEHRFRIEKEAMLKDWHVVEVVPDRGSEPMPRAQGAGRRSGQAWVDEERLELLRLLIEQDEALFGLKDSRPVERANHAVVFPGFMILENPTTQHALYVIETSRISHDDIPDTRRAFEAWVGQTAYTMMMGMKKTDLQRIPGTERVIHNPDRDWRSEVQEIVERRLG